MFFFNSITLKGAVPTFLSVQDFDDWSNKFVNLFNQMTSDPTYMIRKTFPFNLTIEFNDTDCPIRNYGVSKPEIEDLLREILGNDISSKRIDDIIKSRKIDDSIWDILRNKYGSLCENKYKEIEEILKSDAFSQEISAEYIHDNNKIVFYKKVINKMKIETRTLSSLYEEIYSQMLLYSYLYKYNESNFLIDVDDLINRNDYTSEVIKCSLSEYICKKYCDKYGINSDRYLDLVKHSVLFYPYSGALCIYDDLKFEEILFLVHEDMDKALRLLFGYCYYLFYGIKNRKEIKIKNKDNGEYPKLRVNSNHKGKIIYLLPYDIDEFYDNLTEIRHFFIYVYYKDGSIDTHITKSEKISDSSRIISNVITSDIIKNNPRFDDIKYIIASCQKYSNGVNHN